MAKAFNHAVLTASDLLEGDALWWTAEGWSRAIEGAIVAKTPEEAEALNAVAAQPEHEALVVGPYLVDLAPGEELRPLSRREAIRADREPTFAYGEAAPLRAAA